MKKLLILLCFVPIICFSQDNKNKKNYLLFGYNGSLITPFGMFAGIYSEHTKLGVFINYSFGKDFKYNGVLLENNSSYINDAKFIETKLRHGKSYNLGLITNLNKKQNILLYAGAGLIDYTYYNKYYDSSLFVSSDGYFYVHNNKKTSIEISFTAGLMYKMNNIIIMAGFNYPQNISIGIGFLIDK